VRALGEYESLESTHDKTPDLYNELRKRLPTLRSESREKGTYQSGGRSGHLLADRLWSEGAGDSTGKNTHFETFFAKAPKINPSRALIKGVVCGVRVEDIEEPTMREIRYLDRLVDELARGKTMDKILRK
jgi:hypothetical protein